jgi:serine/threonine protein kinase/tetratricopeptide (TPR) repeat protein
VQAIGSYKILETLGRGGMGEVYLAHDPATGRNVALKRIRPDLLENKAILRRFLREAKVAGSLTHPSIVPIFSIHAEPPDVYYTMAYVEGETLRKILRTAKEGGGGSIPELSRIFLQICEAIAYTHSKNVLHRDLKPENIIVGKYGEVMIIDWGIAESIGSSEEAVEVKNKNPKITRPGKIAGTLAYMAPERIQGHPSSVKTDLYALGVILYQILTLKMPFQRKSLAVFRKQVDSEELIDPIEMAPYRDIPHPLAAICLKCLAKDPTDRFANVEELIEEMKKTIEGRPEWLLTAELDLNRKSDWLFQENILLAKHLAISRNFDETNWAAISISKAAFADNLRIDAEVKIEGEGIGFMLSVPSPHQIEEGYLIWISPTKCQLFRSNALVHESPLTLKNRIRIEKIDDYLRLFVDDELKLAVASHLPMPGKHVGILTKDDHFELKSCRIYDGSRNVMVGCLAVPNAFLSHSLYDDALEEYQRIGQCFPGRIEGREALFRAGLTLLEKAKKTKNEEIYHLALKEFEKLYRTSGAPLEYLGKSMVYEAMGEFEEEAKCLELILRKFSKHPLLPIVKEHIVYRMHESSLNNREAAYRLILLAIQHIPEILEQPDTQNLLSSLKTNLERLPFIEGPANTPTEIAIQLAFWLAKVPLLLELIKKPLDEIPLCNALYCLIELEAGDEVEKILPTLPENRKKSLLAAIRQKTSLDVEQRAIYHILRQEVKDSPASVREKLKKLKTDDSHFKALELWSLMFEKKWKEAAAFIAKHPPVKEDSPLHFPFGCYLYAQVSHKKALDHFSSVLDTPHPPTPTLPSHFLTGRIDEKKLRAFWWEKKELHRQIEWFYKVIGKHEKTKSLK